MISLISLNIGVIVGNLLSLFGMGANAISSTRKTAKGVLLWQSLSQGIYFVCAMILKGYSAAVQNIVSVVRNLVAIRNVKSKALEWILTIAGLLLGLVFNNRGWLGLLPVLGNLQYTLAIFRFKDNEQALKLSFLISVVCYCIFNFVIYNFVGGASDMVVIITTSIVLIRNIVKKRKEIRMQETNDGAVDDQ